MGKSPCKTGKPEIRYYFDIKAFIPLAFEYTGCGGNKNNFKSEGECRNFRVGYDYVVCAAGSKELNTVKGFIGPCSTDVKSKIISLIFFIFSERLCTKCNMYQRGSDQPLL
ncbi:Protein CBG06774 [Caenorhabditis briggsae]|uniref:Protein CBG06774 n=1 Tax=Caenorhabditis briggsae TaxID=6238 RepID=A8X317_CAEBR|nr:Protein CBG06774 [Caenorhabditis briggsae]CAP27027.2 Protein CBG06774 [Caenorhabditis briggsae]